jgi:hypothetical protein
MGRFRDSIAADDEKDDREAALNQADSTREVEMLQMLVSRGMRS